MPLGIYGNRNPLQKLGSASVEDTARAKQVPTQVERSNAETQAGERSAAVVDENASPQDRAYWHFVRGRKLRESGKTLAEALEGLHSREDELAVLEGYIVAWVKTEPQGALDYLKDMQGTQYADRLMNLAIRTWATAEPVKALEWVNRSLNASSRAVLGQQIAEAWARTNPAEASAWLSSHAADPVTAAMLEKALRTWGSTQPEKVRDWLASPAGAAAGSKAVPVAAAGMAIDNPSYAWNYLDESTRSKTGQGIAAIESDTLLKTMGGAASQYVESVSEVFREWANESPDAASEAAFGIRAAGLRDAAMQGLAVAWSARNAYAAMVRFASNKAQDPSVRAAAVTSARPLVAEPVKTVVAKVTQAAAGNPVVRDKMLAAFAAAAAEQNEPESASAAAAQIADPKLNAEIRARLSQP